MAGKGFIFLSITTLVEVPGCWMRHFSVIVWFDTLASGAATD